MTTGKMTLYDLTVEGLLLTQMLENSGGELSPEVEKMMDDLLVAGADRIDAAASVVRSLQASADANKTEAERLMERASNFEKQADKLKERMVIALDSPVFNGKVKTDRFTVWTQKAADRVAFDVAPDADLEAIGQAYPAIVRVRRELDKQALADAVKAGKAVPDAITVTPVPGVKFLRIK